MLYHKRPTKDPRGASDEGAPLVFIKNLRIGELGTMTKKEIMNEYGDCTREQMLAYLTKIQNLQKKAAGKLTVDVHLLHDSGAIFGGVVREPEISICVTVMDVYDHEDYQKSWDLYQFYPANKNDEMFADFKKDIEQFIKDFDKEWKRRRANYIKRHGKDCV